MVVSSYEELKAALAARDVREIECRGKIVFPKPLRLSGKKNLVIKGPQGEKAVFSGSAEICGGWKPQGGGISVRPLPRGLDVRELFVNGEHYHLARYPNYAEGERLGGCTTYEELAGRLSKYADVSMGYVRALHKDEWGGNSYFLKSAKAGRLGLEWVGDNNRGGKPAKTKMLAENLLEELDAPGEWYFDRTRGLLYVYFRDGDNPASAKVEYGVCADLFLLDGCSGVSFENLRFEKTNRTLFGSAYVPITRSDWAVAERGAVFAENCENVVIRGCDFRYVGGNCIFFRGRNVGNRVEDCAFEHIGASGVLIFGDRSACRSLSTWQRHLTRIPDKKAGPKNELYAEDCRVSNCFFSSLGEYEKQSAPVSLSVAHGCKITSCTIRDVPRAGINICDGTFGGHLIADNDISGTVCETGDHGAFNSWGRDRYWSYPVFNTQGAFGRFKKKYCLLDAVDTTVIRHNRIADTHGFGIDLDDGSSNYEICDNLCLGSGIKLRDGFYRRVRNNVIIGAPLDLHCTFRGNDDRIERNVVCCKKPLNVIFLNRGFTTKLEHNLFVGCGEEILKSRVFKNSGAAANKVIEKDISGEISEGRVPLKGFTPLSKEFGVPLGALRRLP